MKKQHKFLTILLIIILCVTMVTALIACDNSNDSADEVKDTSEFITNGNFEVTTSENFPKIPSGWSGSAGSTTSGNETEVDNKALAAGVIDTDDKVYEKNKRLWNRLPNPGAVATGDTNILMIYNKIDNSYKYTSNNFSLSANKIFRIDISVKTQNLSDGSYGAYIKIAGDAFIEFPNIDTRGEWLTYSAMIKTSNISSNSINIILSNGKDGKKDGKLSQGYAFFDNIVVTEIENTDNKTKEQQYDEFEAGAKDNIQQDVDSLVLGDSSFKNISGTKNPFTARKWTGVTSSNENGDNAPSGSDYLERGVVDTSETGIPAIAAGINPKGPDSKFLMLNNKEFTAYGYRTDNKIKIAAGDNYFKLTVWVRTKNIEGKGAYIQIKNSTDKNEEIITIDNIISNDDWSAYSIFIKADSKRSKEIYLQVGLGTGGKGDSVNNVKGAAFFDEISLTPASAAEYAAAEANNNNPNATEKAAALESTYGNSITIDDVYNPDKYVAGYYSNYDGIPDSYRGNLSISNNEISIKSDMSAITRYIYKGYFTIAPNNHYRLSFKIKTKSIDENKGIEIKWYKKNISDGENAKTDTEITSLNLTNFNTENVDESLLDKDGFTEFSFLFQGAIKEETRIYFEVVMGSGTNLTPDTLVSGEVVMKDFALFNVFYADYNSESGTYVKKNSFKSETTSISNEDFNQVDLSATKTYLDSIAENEDQKFNEGKFLNGNEDGIFGLPTSWTTSDKEQLKNLYAGIYNSDNAKQTELLKLGGSDFLRGMPSYNAEGNNNFLAISTLPAEQTHISASWGFTSPSISISKGKYYEISVWAKMTEQDSSATINLLSSSKTVIESMSVQKGDWHQYTFYVKAGFDNSTVYLELKLGDNSDGNARGTVFFDMPHITTIEDMDIYETAIKEIDSSTLDKVATTFSTITFDNTTVNSDNDALDTPDGWTGSHADSDAPAGDGKSIAGVYNRNHGSPIWFGGEYEEGKRNEPIEGKDLLAFMDAVPTLKIVNDEDVEEFDRSNNNNVLVINNNAASEYTYTTTLADNSLTENKYYEISLYVLTYNIGDKSARIQLKLHNSTYVFSKNEDRGINVNTVDKDGNSQWVRYSFFISTEDNADIDNVELSVSLGTSGEDNYVSGYLFVDNVSISEITQERFDAKVPEDKFPTDENADGFVFDKSISSTNHRIVFTEDDLNKDPETEPEKELDPLLWLYITSGVIGGLLIIVVIIFLLKKFNIFGRLSKKSGNFTEKGNETYNRNRVDANKTNSQSRDINKKHQD